MLKADAVKLLDGFISGLSNGVQYVIPIYQRNYTWDKKAVSTLLFDIESLLKKKKTHIF